jgi:hypothetical protein
MFPVNLSDNYLKLGIKTVLKPSSFHPERVLFRPGGVNLRACLCGVPKYASAQPLDFLASTKNASFSNRKLLLFHPEFPDGRHLKRAEKGAGQITPALTGTAAESIHHFRFSLSSFTMRSKFRRTCFCTVFLLTLLGACFLCLIISVF